MASGGFIGEIEPIGHNLWRWPFRQMQPGDYFTVSRDHKPVGAVRQYAYSEGARLDKRFTVTTDGEVHTVTCEAPEDKGGRTPAQIAAEKAVFEGGDGDKYLGVLVPPKDGTRWSWPFGRMEPGQYFHVSHYDRHPERVRQLVAVRAAMLGIQVSVQANDPVMSGHARVEYVDVRVKVANHVLTYEMANDLLMRCYDKTFDDLQVWDLQVIDGSMIGRTRRIDLPQIAAPRLTDFLLKMENDNFGVTLDKEGITVTGLGLRCTFREWKMQEALS